MVFKWSSARSASGMLADQTPLAERADHHLKQCLTRRAMLSRTAGGLLGSLALSYLLGQEGRAGQASRPRAAQAPSPLPLSPAGRGVGVRGATHHRATAQSVICLFQHGGPSQMDLFDPKPELTRRHGQPYRGSIEAHFHTQTGNVLGSPFRFRRFGQAGMELSELLPHTGRICDDITLVRSMTTESVDHEAALRMIHSGKIFAGRPALGSWVLYGLGSLRDDLPAYVVLSDPGGLPVDGPNNWSSGFLPAIYQGTPFRPTGAPVANLAPPREVGAVARRQQLDLLNELNGIHRQRHPDNTELDARIRQYEMAARMQTAVPEALDLAGESAETRRLYGLDNPRCGVRTALPRGPALDRAWRPFRAVIPERPTLGHAQPERRPSARTCAP